MRRPIVALQLLLALALAACAQETQLGSDFRREGTAVHESCFGAFSFTAIGKCAYTLFTDHPLHVAAGSIAPQNGFGFGPAFVTHWTPNESWRLNWDFDAIGSTNGSWRAGGYMTAVWDRHGRIGVEQGRPQPKGGAQAKASSQGKTGGESNLEVREFPVFHILAQSISLNTLDYFGQGPNTSDTARSYFGMRETIAGFNTTWPVPHVPIAFYNEVYGRFVDLRPSLGRTSPSIEQLYSPATAPGLDRQPHFAQFTQGVRLAPSFSGGYVRLNYALNIKEYVAVGDSTFSFQRFTADLNHQFPIYLRTRGLAGKTSNGPDDCSVSAGTHSCPAVTREREGSFSLRFLMNESFTAAGHVVPFYFQPTLGGSDIDGSSALGSYQDYRFRAPNDILARATFEYSIWGPLGFTAIVDEGKAALRGADLDLTHLRHSYSVGLNLRAGGFPMIFLLFSFGGHEGTHTTAAMNPSLLGSSARPSLY